MSVLFVAVGGFIGSITRFYISAKTAKKLAGTWVANISGSILLGVLFRFYMEGLVAEWLWFLAGTGFCGAYTTFSTFGNETLLLLIERNYKTAAIYISSSLFTSLFFVFFIVKA